MIDEPTPIEPVKVGKYTSVEELVRDLTDPVTAAEFEKRVNSPEYKAELNELIRKCKEQS